MQGMFTRFFGLVLICLFSAGCRTTPAPSPTVIPFPTFTSTPIPTPTPTVLPPSPLVTPTPEPTDQSMAVRETVRLPATLYFLSMAGQIWAVSSATREHHQLTQEAAPIIDFDVAQTHGRLVYVTNNQLIEFDPVSQQRIVKLTTLTEAELWALHEDGGRYCTKCDTDQILAPRYSPDGARIAFAQSGINVIASGAKPASPQQIQANVPLLVHTQDANLFRFYNDSKWSLDGSRLVLHAVAWEWTGNEIYDFDQGSLQIVRSPTMSGIHLCCEWQWGADDQTGYMTTAVWGGPIEDLGLYRVDARTSAVTQLTTGASTLQRLQRGACAAHQTAFGELYAFIWMNDAQIPWQPALYTMHRIDPSGGDPTPLNQYQVPIEGEVLWASDGSGAVVMTANVSPPGEPARGKFVWLAPKTAMACSDPSRCEAVIYVGDQTKEHKINLPS